MNEFEEHLRHQSLRPVPLEWREQILAAASRTSKVERPAPEGLWPSSLISRLSTILWPHPVAWAGLAAAWIFIFTVDFSIRDQAPSFTESNSSPPSEVMVELRQQQRMLAELMGPRETRDADRQKILLPRPRSESGKILKT